MSTTPPPALVTSPPAGICGLYCDACPDQAVTGECHGCGCACGQCAGEPHRRHCAIAACALGKGLESCADCPDLPCTTLIEFAHDPVWRTHLPVIENLRRRQAVGTPRWLAEQAAYWADPQARARFYALHDECAEHARRLRAKEQQR